jgi:hypothetical protein
MARHNPGGIWLQSAQGGYRLIAYHKIKAGMIAGLRPGDIGITLRIHIGNIDEIPFLLQ